MSFKEFELSSCDGASFLSSDISYVVFPMSTFKVPVQVCGVCGDVVAFFYFFPRCWKNGRRTHHMIMD